MSAVEEHKALRAARGRKGRYTAEETQQRSVLRSKAQQAAYSVLANRHKAEYDAIYRELAAHQLREAGFEA